MDLSPSKLLLMEARAGSRALGAFNAVDAATVLGVIRGAERAGRPVIVQTSVSTVRHTGWALLRAMVREAARPSPVPVVLHLDHCTDLEFVFQTIRAGWTSVMFDGSRLPFEENVAATRRVVEVARDHEVTVEAELGHIGGVEDGMAGGGHGAVSADEAVAFAERTGVDALALGLGNAHGIYTCPDPVLDLELLDRVSRRIPTPLVLHGASGLPYGTVRACVQRGVSKVNYSTDLKLAYRDAVSRWLAQGTDDLLRLQKAVVQAVETLVVERIQVLSGTAVEPSIPG
jgi:tagatose 1,6-diphosphate aldolase GatY/KbaY